MINIKQIITILFLLVLVAGCGEVQTTEDAGIPEQVQEPLPAVTENLPSETVEETPEEMLIEEEKEMTQEEELKQVTLSSGEGYNFKEEKKYSGENIEVFMKVDLIYAKIAGLEKNMLESRSSMLDNDFVFELEDAKPVPRKDYYTNFYEPQKEHVYSFQLWSFSENFEDMPDIAIKVTEVTENSITFVYKG